MSSVAAIIIPTRGRPRYLDRALASLADQARSEKVEIIVVDDGPSLTTRTIAEAHGARYLDENAGDGVNAARNRGIAATIAPLLIFIDDDVEVNDGWLAALLAAAATQPSQVGVFTGPIRAKLEDHRFRACGREGWPITTTDFGDSDCDCSYAWSANVLIRRSAFDAVGLFDPFLARGTEQEWEDRWRECGGRIRYVAAAGVDHLRIGDQARLRSLCAAARTSGRWARRYDERRGVAPGILGELRTLVGCIVHGPRRLCMMGPVTAAHSLGRVEATISRSPLPGTPVISGENDFLSLSSGLVAGRRGQLMAVADKGLDLLESRRRQQLQRLAKSAPRRRVLVMTIASQSGATLVEDQRAELLRSRHDVELVVRSAGSDGKFENLNKLVAELDLSSYDWIIVLDDDVALPKNFLDSFLLSCEEFNFQIAQPAHRLHSHAAWPITRRRRGVRSRRTTFVEIGPLTAFTPLAAQQLIPFPQLRMGWGLDSHWAAIAAQRGWPIGIVDATPVGHTLRPVAADYPRAEAIAEAQQFLADKPYLRRDEVRTIGVYR